MSASREELRADLLDDHGYCVNCGEDTEDCECAFDEFIDATVAAGWRKLSLDDATVERAARAIFPSYWDDDAAECFETPEALTECQKGCTDHVRAVLAAAVEAGHE